MTNTLYVSNIAFEANEQDIKNHFSTIGEVTKIQIILDRETRRPRGFCFVSYSTSDLAAEALKTLNGSMLLGRPLRISEARPREQNHNTLQKNPPAQKHNRDNFRQHHPTQQHQPPASSAFVPTPLPSPQFAPARKKFNKHKFQKRHQEDDDFDRPKSRRPRPQDFDDEDF